MLATEKKIESSGYPLNTDNIDRIVALTKEKSHRMPSGLTREERRLWARNLNRILLLT